MTFGKRGVRQTVGLPGTGLSFTTHTSRSKSSAALLRPSTAPTVLEVVEPERFGITAEPIASSAGRTRKLFFIVGALVIGAASVFPVPEDVRPLVFLTGGVLAALGFARPSRASLEAAEQRRIEDLARTELARRESVFADAVASLSTSQALSVDVKRVLAKQHELGLTDLEVGRFQLEKLQGIDALLDFQLNCGGRLIEIPGHEQVVAPDACYFVGHAVYDKRGDNDPSGTLYLTNARALFVSTDGLTTSAWKQVLSVSLDSRTLQIQRRDRQNPHLFDFSTYADAMKAEFIAKHMLTSVQDAIRPTESATIESRPGTEPADAMTIRRAPTHAVRVDLLALDDEQHCDLGAGQGYPVAIVGESYRQTALRALSAGRRIRGEEVRFVATVTPEPTNTHDPRAVRVDILNGAHIGYLSKEDAVAYELALKAVGSTGKHGVCRARLVGGSADKPSIGVLLDLLDPDVLIAKLSGGSGQAF
jgi:hypothetical protein